MAKILVVCITVYVSLLTVVLRDPILDYIYQNTDLEQEECYDT